MMSDINKLTEMSNEEILTHIGNIAKARQMISLERQERVREKNKVEKARKVRGGDFLDYLGLTDDD